MSCVSPEQVSVFAIKEKKLSKQKVKSADSVLPLQSKSMNQIFAAVLKGTDQAESLQVVHGSLFGMVKQHKTIFDAGTKQFIAKVPLTDTNPEVSKSKDKADDQQYQVARLGEEDVPMTSNMLRLLPNSDTMSLENIESRLTSVSLKDSKKIAGASLTTVLSQALQAEDQEQLDWILTQRD